MPKVQLKTSLLPLFEVTPDFLSGSSIQVTPDFLSRNFVCRFYRSTDGMRSIAPGRSVRTSSRSHRSTDGMRSIAPGGSVRTSCSCNWLLIRKLFCWLCVPWFRIWFLLSAPEYVESGFARRVGRLIPKRRYSFVCFRCIVGTPIPGITDLVTSLFTSFGRR